MSAVYRRNIQNLAFAVGMTYGHLNLFQTEIDIAQVESVQRDQAEMEGQDQAEQRDMEVLAYAM